ncbi:FAD-dependent 5-carboxymethylaminomethyl-2-thiouridine(34) oxidoreductase MnmC [Oxalobacteraceae bacterium A2-2]
MSGPRVILDAGFGQGAYFLQCRAQALACGQPLYYLAVAPQPPQAAQFDDAQLRAAWPLLVPGWHRIALDGGRVTLDLMVGEAEVVLPQVRAGVDHFHLPYGLCAPDPKKLARTLAALARPGATLLARAPDELLVWMLAAVGFRCAVVGDTPDISAEYRAGHRTRAAAPPAAERRDIERVGAEPRAAGRGATGGLDIEPLAPEPRPAEPHVIVRRAIVRRAIVIGAGVAGAAACERLCAHGWDVTLLERHAGPGQEASGNRAGIFMPLLSKDDNIPTRLSRAAYLHALRAWDRLGGVGAAFTGARCGVLQLARDARHAQVQRDVIEAWNYPQQYARWLDARQAGALLGQATPHGGWLFEQGGWARPATVCAAMLDACGARLRRLFHAEALTLERSGGQWQARDADGRLLAVAPTVVVANGTGARTLAQTAELPLWSLRGQVTHLALEHGAPALPLVVCREAYVTPPSEGIVSAGATYDNDDDAALRLSSQEENLARLADILPGAHLGSQPLAGRVGFRCAGPDRLPLAGALPDYPAAGRLEQLADVPRLPGLYGLLGYASRGLIWAPLMAELLVSQLEGLPPPLEAALADAVDPGRFLLKQRRREQ